MPSNSQRRRLKYEPLELYLREKFQSEQTVTLSFDEIQKIIQAKLPDSTFVHREWWSNQQNCSNRPQEKAWLNAGYKVDSVNQEASGGFVCFKRM